MCNLNCGTEVTATSQNKQCSCVLCTTALYVDKHARKIYSYIQNKHSFNFVPLEVFKFAVENRDDQVYQQWRGMEKIHCQGTLAG